jgi:NTE family protein
MAGERQCAAMHPRPCTALVLSGGGARGAYQVGVLRGLAELGVLSPVGSSFDVLVGSSAGALNATALAASADAFADGLARLEGVWRAIRPVDVFRTDVASLGRIGARWAWDLSFGGVTGRVRAISLLDTSPLRSLLAEQVAFARIRANVTSGTLRALAVIATELHTANGVVFLAAPPDTPLWQRRRWRIERTRIGVEHLMASAAIPIFFPPVRIGGAWFGDGSVRNTAPLSAAINLGAERIVAIGVSGPSPRERRRPRRPPTIAQIAGVLLDAVMLDAIEVDVDHSERVNTSLLYCRNGGGQPFRPIDVLWLRPSRRIRELVAQFAHRVPRILRYLMHGLGSDEAVTELTSYLLFDSEFCGRLIDLGRTDTLAEAARIERFFASTVSGRRPAARGIRRGQVGGADR